MYIMYFQKLIHLDLNNLSFLYNFTLVQLNYHTMFQLLYPSTTAAELEVNQRRVVSNHTAFSIKAAIKSKLFFIYRSKLSDNEIVCFSSSAASMRMPKISFLLFLANRRLKSDLAVGVISNLFMSVLAKTHPMAAHSTGS